jgi:hypothetical protein
MHEAILDPRNTLAFVGESVTDCGRRDDRRHHLGRTTLPAGDAFGRGYDRAAIAHDRGAPDAALAEVWRTADPDRVETR